MNNWKEHVTDRDFKCPVTYHDHKIYVGEGLSGRVRTKYCYCYDENGNELWKHATDNTAGFLWCGASVISNSHFEKLGGQPRKANTFI